MIEASDNNFVFSQTVVDQVKCINVSFLPIIWVSDCCYNAKMSNFSAISWQEHVTFNDNDIYCVLDQHP